MDRRKHYTQMTSDETQAVLNAVRSVKAVNITEYTRSRMAERHITALHVALTLAKGMPIEVHNNRASEIRVLVRGEVAGKWCNVVVSLTTGTLVTCFWNELNDTHRTLDKTQYKWSVDLKTVV